METRYYPGVEADLNQLITELKNLYDSESYEVQTMQISATTVLQARKTSTLRDITGLSSALTLKITPETGGTRIEIGMQKWFDKAALSAVALILYGPLLALPVLGAYWQYRLTEETWKIIEDHITSMAGGYVPPLPGRCGNCGATTGTGYRYCSKCGADLSRGCSSCGAELKDNTAQFCYRCGKSVKNQVAG
jgi:hypothetical protein